MPVMCGGVVRIEGDGLPELAFGAGPVPIVSELDGSQRGMRLRKCGVKLERLHRRLLGLGKSFFGRQAAVMAQHKEGIRDSGVAKRVIWIFSDGLLKVV